MPAVDVPGRVMMHGELDVYDEVSASRLPRGIR